MANQNLIDPQEIKDALERVRDEASFIDELLSATLKWEIPDGVTALDEITYEWPKDEHKAPNVDKKLVGGRILEVNLTGPAQHWGVFILEFNDARVFSAERGMTGVLREVLRWLVPSRRKAPHKRSWNRDHLLFICTHNYQQFRFAHFKDPVKEKTQPRLAAFGWESQSAEVRTVCEFNLTHLGWPDDPSNEAAWVEQWSAAFDVEKVTKRFYQDYAREDERLRQLIAPLLGEKDPEAEPVKMFTQTLLNRLMFLRFIERKGWLHPPGGQSSRDYLRLLYSAGGYRGKSFYAGRLHKLFFEALAREGKQESEAIGKVPFLNGGLFEENALDEKIADIPDEAFEPILGEQGLFYRYNFTVQESTPLNIEVAVDPEMLGKVFEELVTGRHESGSYYTPRPVVSFMCREALKGYLADATEIDAEKIAAFVDKHQVTGITIPGARKIAEALDNVRAVDPACGSGAYLLGLLHEMVDLYQLLYSDKLKTDDRELHRIKLDIIEKCLYGVDKDPFATNIAMLRLWLSLSVDSAHPQSLPNLDFKIETGDSLTGPNPRDMPDLMRVSLDEEARQLAILKGRYMRARGEEKRSLRRLILSDQRRIATKLRSLSPGSIDWRVQFCEIFLSERDGFSVVVANPPYVNMVQMDAADPAYREQLRVGFSTARGGFDLFVPFMERGVQLLCRNGMFAYIVPNKLLSAEYSATLRHHFAQHMTLQSLADLSRVPVFSAAVYPVIALAQKKKTVNPISVIAYRAHATSLDNVELVELGRTPMYAATRANGLWSPLIDKVGDQDVGNITTKCQSLAELGDVSGAASVSEAYEWKDALVDSGERLYERHPERYAPFIVSGNVRRHFHTWRADNVQYIKRSYRMPVLDKHHHAISSRRVRQVESCKLIISGMSKRPTCVWDERGIAAGKSTVIIIPKKKDDGYFLAGVINSQPMSQIYKSLFGSLSLSGGYLRFGPPQIRALPIGLA